MAADHGSPTAYETLRLLTVQLVDTNDNVPQFYEEYNFHVSENRPKDYFIGKVTAEDKDEGRHAKVYYYIEAGKCMISYRIYLQDIYFFNCMLVETDRIKSESESFLD